MKNIEIHISFLEKQYNQAYMDERSIIITTNFLLEELEKIEPRITDRLREMALILKFDGKSFR